MVLGGLFFKFFFEIFEKSKKRFFDSIEEKFKNSFFVLFLQKIILFLFEICILHVLSFLLMYITIIFLRISNLAYLCLIFCYFFHQSFDSQYCQNYSSKTVVHGVYRQQKIKKIKYNSFLCFRLSSYSFRMPKTNPGHNGPPHSLT